MALSFCWPTYALSVSLDMRQHNITLLLNSLSRPTSPPYSSSCSSCHLNEIQVKIWKLFTIFHTSPCQWHLSDRNRQEVHFRTLGSLKWLNHIAHILKCVRLMSQQLSFKLFVQKTNAAANFYFCSLVSISYHLPWHLVRRLSTSLVIIRLHSCNAVLTELPTGSLRFHFSLFPKWPLTLTSKLDDRARTHQFWGDFAGYPSDDLLKKLFYHDFQDPQRCCTLIPNWAS